MSRPAYSAISSAACARVVACFAVLGGLLIASDVRGASQFPAPTGPWKCGRATFQWRDDSRPEAWTDETDDHRELLVTLWYPASPDPAAKPGAYVPRIDRLPHVKPFDLKVAQSMVSHAYDDAPLAADERPWPVLVFSPGAGASPYHYAAFLEEMASHGYVVAAIDPSYEGVGQVLLDGRAFAATAEMFRPNPAGPNFDELARQHYLRRVEVRAADAVFVLKQLGQLNKSDNRLAGRLDLTRVGVFGHSIGGMAATQACAIDERFKAAANLDGVHLSRPLLPAEEGGGMKQPLMFLAKPVRRLKEDELVRLGMSPDEGAKLAAEMTEKIRASLAQVEGGAYYVQIPGAAHVSFSDSTYFIPTDPKEKDRIMALARQFLRAFFDRTLKGIKGSLLDDDSNSRGAVEIERFPAR